MKTKNYFTLLLLLGVGSQGWTQITVNNAESFPIGTKLTFQYCDTTGLEQGGEGAAQTWDYSGLVSNSAPVSVEMLDPTQVSMGSHFPNADLVEKWTDGKFIFTQNLSQSSKLVGFYDSIDNISIDYVQPMLFAKRPIGFGDSITESYTDEYSASGYDFKGGGTVQIKGDGYGTLKLPHHTYQNVLRVKMSQTQIDTIVQFGIVSEFKTVTYLWYDGQNPSALLKINFIFTDVNSKNVSYLVSSLVGVNDISKNTSISVYPNPCSDWLTVITEQAQEVSVYNELGVEVFRSIFTEGNNIIDVSSFSKGLYFIKFLDELNEPIVKQIVIN